MTLHISKGDVFGHLTIVNETKPLGSRRQFICECKCGLLTVATLSDLRSTRIQSCGCSRKITDNRKTHGLTAGGKQHTLFSTLAHMRQRCYNKKDPRYHDYGGRGIRICKQWLAKDGYTTFYMWAMHLPEHIRWQPGRQIDRRDNDGDYSPENCHFVSQSDNVRNTRDNIWVDIPEQVSDAVLDELADYGYMYGCRMFKYEKGKHKMLLIDLWEKYGVKGLSYA